MIRHLLFGATVLLAGCGYSAIDASKVQSMDLREANAKAPISVCGLLTEKIPVVTVRMADGKERVAGGPGDSGFDPEELAWTANGGGIQNPERGDTGKLPNPLFVPPPDVTPLIDNDVAVNVTFKKNANAKLAFVLQPTFACPITAPFGMQGGANGDDGQMGEGGQSGRSPRSGGNGSNGTDGERGPDAVPMDVFLAVVENPKRGQLVYASVQTQDGLHAGYVFAAKGGSLTIVNTGGAGGAGGQGGQGGSGGNGDGACVGGARGGRGGNGGNGAPGGNGGDIRIHIDAAHPELEGLIKTDVRGGAGGPPGNGGNAGAGGSGSSNDANGQICNPSTRSGDFGQAGESGQRGGRDGNPGRVAISREPAESMFPQGVKVGSLQVASREKVVRGPRGAGGGAGPNANANLQMNAGPNGGTPQNQAPQPPAEKDPPAIAATLATGNLTIKPMRIVNDKGAPVVELLPDGTLVATSRGKTQKIGTIRGGAINLVNGEALTVDRAGKANFVHANGKFESLGFIDPQGTFIDKKSGATKIDAAGNITLEKGTMLQKLRFVGPIPPAARATAGLLASIAGGFAP